MRAGRLHHIKAAARNWPDAAGWTMTARELLWLVPLLLLLAWAGGLIGPARPP